MKIRKTTTVLSLVTIFWSCNKQSADNSQTINPILGDISFTETFGQHPTSATDECLRIKTHLSYVESLLRKKDISGLTQEQKESRSRMIDLLHDYWTAGEFPGNYDYPDKRVPCFIDEEGRICAVGYLIEKTASRQTAERINEFHMYDKILEMKEPLVGNWIKTSGLSVEECAMIQPQYGAPVDNSTYINTTDAVFTGVLTGMNFGLTALNFANSAKGIRKSVLPTVSVIFGSGQIGLGVNELYKYSGPGRWGGNDYTAMKKIGMINIAFGTASALIGASRLIENRRKKDRSVAWNVFSFPTAGGQPGLGIYIAKVI